MKRISLCVALLIVLSNSSYAYHAYPKDKLLTSTATFIDVRSINARQRLQKIKPKALWVDPHSLMEINDFLKSHIKQKDKEFIIYCSCPDDEYAIAMAEIMDREGYTNVYILKDGFNTLDNYNLLVKDVRK